MSLESEILETCHTIAVVGLSEEPARASYAVASYLQRNGYRIIPVNPNYEVVLGEKCYPGLTDIPEPVDVVEVFRKAEYVPRIVDEAIKIKAKVVWMQEGVVNEEAAEKARKAGLKVVMDKCMAREHFTSQVRRGK